MKIKIHSTNFDITPAIYEHIDRKISPLQKFLDMPEVVLCEVEIGRTTKHHKSGDIFKAEVNITGPNVKQIYAIAEGRDLYSAIDIVKDDIEREIVTQKERRNTLFRRGGAKVKAFLKRLDIRPKRWK